MGFGGRLLQKLSGRNRASDSSSQLGVVMANDAITVIDLAVSAGARRILDCSQIGSGGDYQSALITLSEKNGWQDRSARLCLPLLDFQSLLIEKPQGSEEELRNSLGWILRDELDDRPENLIFDVCSAPPTPEGIERVLAVSMSRAALGRAEEMFAAAGLQLEAVDIAPLCVGRALCSEVPKNGQLLYLHMEARAGCVFVYGDGEYHHSKRLQKGLEWVEESAADPDTADAMVNDLAVGLRRAADDYRRQHGWLGDEVSVVLPPLSVFSDGLVASLQEALGWKVKVFDLRAYYDVDTKVGALGLGVMMAVGGAL